MRIGSDVGGTNTKCVALTSPDGAELRVVDLGSVPTAADTGPGGVRDQVIGLDDQQLRELLAVENL